MKKRFQALTLAPALMLALVMPLAPVVAHAAPTPSPTELPAQRWHSDVTRAQESCSKEPIFMAYYRTWRDKEMEMKDGEKYQNVISMTDVPEGIDILSLFHVDDHQKSDEKFWKKFDSEYRKTLRERKTRVIRTISVTSLVKEAPSDHRASDKEYIDAAKKVVDEYVDKHGLDGLDVDVEADLSYEDKVKMRQMFRALSLYLGPQSESGKLLIFDTDRDAQKSYVENAAGYVDYVFYQSYRVDSSKIEHIWHTYAPFISSCMFVPGFANEEEGDKVNHWNDAVGADVEGSRAIEKANWQPRNGIKGGYFEYAIDRDGLSRDQEVRPTDFRFAKRAIAVVKSKKFEGEKKKVSEEIGTLKLQENQRLQLLSAVSLAKTFDEVRSALDEAKAEAKKAETIKPTASLPEKLMVPPLPEVPTMQPPAMPTAAPSDVPEVSEPEMEPRPAPRGSSLFGSSR